MSIPQIRTEAIEAVGRKILMEYDPSLLSGQPCSVPIETIIETKFDLILEFHTLRKNPKILGETIFDDGAVDGGGDGVVVHGVLQILHRDLGAAQGLGLSLIHI